MSFQPITMKVALFASPEDTARSRKALLWLLEALVQINAGFIRANRPPLLYESHVVYEPEQGTEIWRDIPHVLADGYGDCEDLAAWRCAELQVAGVNARPYIGWRKVPTGNARFHALVRLPDGRIEDPSLALGMGGNPIVRRPVYIHSRTIAG